MTATELLATRFFYFETVKYGRYTVWVTYSFVKRKKERKKGRMKERKKEGMKERKNERKKERKEGRKNERKKMNE
jgi:hypothetical protein